MKSMADFKTIFRMYATGRTSGWLTIVVTGLLFPASLVYRLVVWLRNLLYNIRLLPVVNSGIPVISVGNIAAGGTGKTPVVDFLVRHLADKGRKVGIVSRGYGGSFSGVSALVSDGQSCLLDAEQAGDEPALLARRNPAVPVAISPKRIDGIRLLIERCQIDCVVLDDAFQHRSVARDLNIVLLDGRYPTGNGHLLPAGILREPFNSIRRADLAIMTRCDTDCPDMVALPITTLKCRHELATEVNSLDGGTLDFKDMKGKKIFAFAGIAEPEAFFSGLRDAGVKLSGSFAFPDHVVYSTARLATLVSAAGKADLLLTTEKDAVKIDPDRLPLPCYSVGVQPVFADEAPLLTLIDRILIKS
jgi:tetraacyldisaccharide 4'-kinase